MLDTDRIERGLVLGNFVLVAKVFAKNGFLVLDSVTGECEKIHQGNGGEDSCTIDYPLLGSLT